MPQELGLIPCGFNKFLWRILFSIFQLDVFQFGESVEYPGKAVACLAQGKLII